MTEEQIVNVNDPDLLKAIEFTAISRINIDSDEQVTIIGHKELIDAIKIAIAKQEIFVDFTSRIKLKEDPSSSLQELLIVPDSAIEEAIDREIANHISNDSVLQEKLANLNKELGKIDEETLTRISTLIDEELSEEELTIKRKIQDIMIDAGKGIDDNLGQEGMDRVLQNAAKETTVINMKEFKKKHE